jgi:short-subunit dehydrogenase
MKKNHGTVLITGASAGIGRELAVEFGPRSETLVLVARRLDRLERLRAELLERPGLKFVALAADLSVGAKVLVSAAPGLARNAEFHGRGATIASGGPHVQITP